MKRHIFIIMVLAVAAVPALSDQAWADGQENIECWKASNMAYQIVPTLFYSHQPDSLLSALLAWEDDCGDSEPLTRIKILASIWDDAFTESIYNDRIIDYLIWRYDPKRQPRPLDDVDPYMASGGVASPADFAFYTEQFDHFTTNLADQILPHTPPNSLEQFFCLFYSGQVDAAYQLLHGSELTGTDLRWYYQREMSKLRQEKARLNVALTAGVWRPKGDLLLVGDHAQLGATVGVRQDRWLGRLVLELRPGRSDHPYLVNHNEISGKSDRWDNVYLGLEIGREVVKFRRHRLDLFVGLGFDGVKPFWEEDLILGTVNANMGIGYRVLLGKDRRWMVGADYRFEAIGERNSGGRRLSGGARTLRFCFCFYPDFGKGRRLSGLGH